MAICQTFIPFHSDNVKALSGGFSSTLLNVSAALEIICRGFAARLITSIHGSVGSSSLIGPSSPSPSPLDLSFGGSSFSGFLSFDLSPSGLSSSPSEGSDSPSSSGAGAPSTEVAVVFFFFFWKLLSYVLSQPSHHPPAALALHPFSEPFPQLPVGQPPVQPFPPWP